MRIARLLIQSAIVILVAPTVIVLVAAPFLGPILKRAVESIGPSYTGGPIAVQHLKIRPLAGEIAVAGLAIGNPEGYASTNAFELAGLLLDVRLRSLLTDTIVVERLLVNGPHLTYERAHGKANFDAIRANVERKAGTGTPAKPAAPPPDKPKSDAKPEKRLVIERLELRDGQVDFRTSLFGRKPLPVPLPPLTLTDIGKDEPLTAPQALARVIGELLNSAGTAIAHSAISLKDFIGNSDKIAADASKGLGRAGQDIEGVVHKGLRKVGLGELIGMPQKDH